MPLTHVSYLAQHVGVNHPLDCGQGKERRQKVLQILTATRRDARTDSGTVMI